MRNSTRPKTAEAMALFATSNPANTKSATPPTVMVKVLATNSTDPNRNARKVRPPLSKNRTGAPLSCPAASSEPRYISQTAAKAANKLAGRVYSREARATIRSLAVRVYSTLSL